MAVNVIEITRVSPAADSDSNSSHDSLKLPLTFFDLAWLAFHPNQRVIFYRPTESTREFLHSVILPKLKRSLPIVLRRYLPLAGRIVWDPQEPKPSIVVSGNDAVSLTIAESDADPSRLFSDGQRPATELRPLVPELAVSDDSLPVFSLQITLFPDQGFCIGITGNHAILDGKTTSMFTRSWAHICKQHQEHGNRAFPSLPEDLTPSFDRSLIIDRTGLDAKMLEIVASLRDDKDDTRSLKLMPTSDIGSDVVRVTLELTREDIEKLRERVKNESSSLHPGLHLSTFVIAYAYLWTCTVKARGGDAERPVAFLFVADFRHRLDPPLPETYFGNCVSPVGCYDEKAKAFMEDTGLVTAVKILSDLVNGLGPRRIERSPEEFRKGFAAAKSGSQFGSVAGSTRLGYYGADFGWGKPVKTEVVSIDNNEAFSMSERRDESGGVEIGICLKKTRMDVFVSLFNDGLK